MEGVNLTMSTAVGRYYNQDYINIAKSVDICRGDLQLADLPSRRDI